MSSDRIDRGLLSSATFLPLVLEGLVVAMITSTDVCSFPWKHTHPDPDAHWPFSGVGCGTRSPLIHCLVSDLGIDSFFGNATFPFLVKLSLGGKGAKLFILPPAKVRAGC